MANTGLAVGTKGSIGNHGAHKSCNTRLHRKHNMLWCSLCRVALPLKNDGGSVEYEPDDPVGDALRG